MIPIQNVVQHGGHAEGHGGHDDGDARQDERMRVRHPENVIQKEGGEVAPGTLHVYEEE